MSLIKKSCVVRVFFILSMLSVFSGHANGAANCARRAVRGAWYGALTAGSAILFAGGILAATAPRHSPEDISPSVIAGTSVMLLVTGANGVYQGLRNLLCENEEVVDQELQQSERYKWEHGA